MIVISITYPELIGTSFPDAIDTYEKLSDITLGTLQQALQYSSLYNQGKLTEAYALLEQYPDLKRCIINADKINKLIDSTKALQTFGLNLKSTTTSQINTLTTNLGTTNTNVSNVTSSVNNLSQTVSNLGTNVTNINTTVNTLNTKVEALEETGSTVTKESIGLGNVDNTADASKRVAYAASAGTASSATNSTNATNATNATYADKVDGFDITISTTDLTAGLSALTTNTFCFVYE